MLTVEALSNWGADVKDGLSRCVNKEDFYLRLVKMADADKSLEKCGEALKEGNLQLAFDMAHALKGVLGNLSLTPVYEPAVELTEALRSKKGGASMELYWDLYEKVRVQKEKLHELCAE